MKKYISTACLMCCFCLGWAMADEVADKTDGSFVGENPKPINSSFSGDDSSSVVNSDFQGQDLSKQTDNTFVGTGSTQAQDTLFAGQSYHQEAGSSTIPPFAQDNSTPTPVDGTFIGEDQGNKTDGSFDGNNYGK